MGVMEIKEKLKRLPLAFHGEVKKKRDCTRSTVVPWLNLRKEGKVALICFQDQILRLVANAFTMYIWKRKITCTYV
jgi:hypothetical protein